MVVPTAEASIQLEWRIVAAGSDDADGEILMRESTIGVSKAVRCLNESLKESPVSQSFLIAFVLLRSSSTSTA